MSQKHDSGPPISGPLRSSAAKVAAAAFALVVILACVAAMVAGLLTLTLALLVVAPIAALLVATAIVVGRGKIRIHVYRRSPGDRRDCRLEERRAQKSERGE